MITTEKTSDIPWDMWAMMHHFGIVNLNVYNQVKWDQDGGSSIRGVDTSTLAIGPKHPELFSFVSYTRDTTAYIYSHAQHFQVNYDLTATYFTK